MRETHAQNYKEVRDSIARDWSDYLNQYMGNHSWLYLPNCGENIKRYCEDWGINMIILSGGDNLGVHPERDLSEKLLIEYALEKQIPILGICRGMQLIHQYFGGKIIISNNSFNNNHVATTHLVETQEGMKQVNSFHSNSIDELTLNKKFEVIARATCDNSIEAIQGINILCLMWHPERPGNDSWTTKYIQTFLKNSIL